MLESLSIIKWVINMIKIGVTCRILIEDGTRKEFVNEDYFKLLDRYNFVPVVLSSTSSKLDELLEMCDCFLIPGGDDIDAEYYQEKNHEKNFLVDPKIDVLDMKVIDYALSHNKPVLGICRGFQIINVYFGGTLIQHIEDNSHKKNYDDDLELNEHSKLIDVLPKKFKINSFHHQGIDELGDGLIVDGTSKGMVELITHERYPLIATQYHIEQLNDSNTDSTMKYFISLINGKRN